MVQMLGWSRAEAAWASCRNRCLAVVVGGEVRGQELDGDGALQAGVLGLVDDGHAACAELAGDLIRAELGAGGERHGTGGS